MSKASRYDSIQENWQIKDFSLLEIHFFQFVMTGGMWKTKCVFNARAIANMEHPVINWQDDVITDVMITGLGNSVKVRTEIKAIFMIDINIVINLLSLSLDLSICTLRTDHYSVSNQMIN